MLCAGRESDPARKAFCVFENLRTAGDRPGAFGDVSWHRDPRLDAASGPTPVDAQSARQRARSLCDCRGNHADCTTKGPGEGTGLGLAVVHGIVQDLGGVVILESEEGKGTVFDLFLPSCTGETSTATPGTSGASGPARAAKTAGTGERILAVDDDTTVLSVTASILRRDGYRPESYDSARKALAAFEADPLGCAMVVSDLAMPELTGFALARRIQALNAETPVVIASGYLDEHSMAEFDSLALAGRLQKPYDVASRLTKVRVGLQQRQKLVASG